MRAQLAANIGGCSLAMKRQHLLALHVQRIANPASLPTLINSARQLANPPPHTTQRYMSTSHYASRPACTDIGKDTLRLPLESTPPNTRRSNTWAIWFAVGVIVLCADALAIRLFCETPLETVILASLTMPLGILTIIAALEARK
jgi:energy-converting hydrogenase Eha subunit A